MGILVGVNGDQIAAPPQGAGVAVTYLNDNAAAPCITARLPPTMATRAGWLAGGTGETQGDGQEPAMTR